MKSEMNEKDFDEFVKRVEILEQKGRDLQRQRETWKIVAEAKKTKDELIAKNLEIKCLREMIEQQNQSVKVQNEWIRK